MWSMFDAWRPAAFVLLAALIPSGARSMGLTTLAVLSGPLLLVPLAEHVLAACSRQPPGAHEGERVDATAWPAPDRPGRPRRCWPWVRFGDLAGCGSAAARSGRCLGPGAAAAVFAALLPIGMWAATAAAGWLAAVGWRFTAEVARWWSTDRRPATVPTLVAWGWLPVAAGWFVASRAGVAPLGFGEPITLLTAAHFHVAGFGLSVLTATIARRSAALPRGPRRLSGAAWTAWGLVSAGPVCVAIGFTFDEPAINMAGAVVVALGIFILCPCLVVAVADAPAAARRMARVAAVVPLVPIVLAVVYSLGPVFGTPAPSVEVMVRAHGIVNALGFVTLGLAAFALIAWGERPLAGAPQEVDRAVVA